MAQKHLLPRLGLDPELGCVARPGAEFLQDFEGDLNAVGRVAGHHVAPDDGGRALEHAVLAAGVKAHVVSLAHKGDVHRQVDEDG